MRLGFPRERAALGFYSERNARVAVESGRTAEIERASVVAQAGARAHGALPAQAHVLAGLGRERKSKSPVSYFSFSRKIEKWKLAQKKIEKVFFPCGKKSRK